MFFIWWSAISTHKHLKNENKKTLKYDLHFQKSVLYYKHRNLNKKGNKMNLKKSKVNELVEKIKLELVDVNCNTASSIEDYLEKIVNIFEETPKSGVCPVCGKSENIELEKVDVSYENCFLKCKCRKCGTVFDEVFEHTGQIIK